MKLYDVPRNSRVRMLEDDRGPPCGIPLVRGDVLQFKRIDGMYSFCIDRHGNIVHPRAWAEVDLLEVLK